jgi:hypothetical protein
MPGSFVISATPETGNGNSDNPVTVQSVDGFMGMVMFQPPTLTPSNAGPPPSMIPSSVTVTPTSPGLANCRVQTLVAACELSINGSGGGFTPPTPAKLQLAAGEIELALESGSGLGNSEYVVRATSHKNFAGLTTLEAWWTAAGPTPPSVTKHPNVPEMGSDIGKVTIGNVLADNQLNFRCKYQHGATTIYSNVVSHPVTAGSFQLVLDQDDINEGQIVRATLTSQNGFAGSVSVANTLSGTGNVSPGLTSVVVPLNGNSTPLEITVTNITADRTLTSRGTCGSCAHQDTCNVHNARARPARAP